MAWPCCTAIVDCMRGLDGEALEFTLESITEFAHRELPDAVLLDLGERDTFPEELVRRMC